MTPSEQLELWLKGESVHNNEREECCPDFSCCRPELLADQDERQAFYDAHHRGDDDTKMAMLMGFLGKSFCDKKIYVAGDAALEEREQ